MSATSADPRAGSARPSVVFVHGLWLTGSESLLLRRRLSAALDADVRAFRYPTVSRTMSEIATELARFVEKLRATTLHLVGHSLGGHVIFRFLQHFPDQPPGRVVFLGTPITGCQAARGVARFGWATALMGRAVAEELLVQRERRWELARALGIIAGTRAMGLGRLFASFTEASDGTVAVSETRLSGASDHLMLPVSHLGMLVSARVARETAHFLREGRFAPLTHGSRASSLRSR